MTDDEHNELWTVCLRLETDYTDYGGKVERWRDPALDYPDCSMGCKWFVPLYDSVYKSYDTDWGVCSKPGAPRQGLLTWEHQAGYNCYEYNEELNDKD